MILEKKVNWYHRARFATLYLFALNLIVVLVDDTVFMEHFMLIQLAVLVLVFLLLMSKRQRIVYKLDFDDINEKLTIYFYQFVFFNYSSSISYSKLDFKYLIQNYGIINRMYALIFLNSKKRIAEIAKVNDAGWTKNEILKIIEMLNLIKDRNVTNNCS